MKSPNHFSGILAAAGIFLSVIALIAIPASAATMTGPAPGGAGAFAPGHGAHAFNATQQQARLSAGLTKLGAQGVDVSEPQADLAAGNTTAAVQWLMAYHKAHPGAAMATNGGKPVNMSAWQKGAGFGMHRGPFNQTAGHHAMTPTPAQGT